MSLKIFFFTLYASYSLCFCYMDYIFVLFLVIWKATSSFYSVVANFIDLKSNIDSLALKVLVKEGVRKKSRAMEHYWSVYPTKEAALTGNLIWFQVLILLCKKRWCFTVRSAYCNLTLWLLKDSFKIKIAKQNLCLGPLCCAPCLFCQPHCVSCVRSGKQPARWGRNSSEY